VDYLVKVAPMKASLAVIILAGGTSRRMGPSKPLEKLADQTMLAQTVMTALSISPSVVVVAGNPVQEAAYRSEVPAGITLVRDKILGRGPLMGLYTGLENVRSEYVAVLPCDCPFVNREVILCLHYAARGADAAVPVWSDGRIEPLHSVFCVRAARRAAVDAFKAEMDTIREMIQQMDKVRLVPMDKIRELDPGLLSFFNINTREDLEEARRIVGQVRSYVSASAGPDRK